MKAWVDRKAFIHNLGHATLAYCGHLMVPGARYLWEAMKDQAIVDFTRTVMTGSCGSPYNKTQRRIQLRNVEGSH